MPQGSNETVCIVICRRFFIKRLLKKIRNVFRKKSGLTQKAKPAEALASKPDVVGKKTASGAHRRPAAPGWALEQFQVPILAGKMRFHDLKLPLEIMRAVAELGFSYTTAVQSLALPPALDGCDITGRAQTGTGKTAAFLICIFAGLLRRPLTGRPASGVPRALVLAPTRELAIQIHNDALALGKYCALRTLVVYGGMDYQKQKVQAGQGAVDLLVATPGRLLDFCQSGLLRLNKVEILIIDEADRMLDMGFIPDVKRIIYSTPPKQKRQTMIFSATLSPDVLRLAAAWMVNPVKVEVEPEKVTLDTTEQKIFSVSARDKPALLLHLLQDPAAGRVLVFCNRRDGVDSLAHKISRHGVACGMLSGDVPQQKRLRILEAFRSGEIRILIATDVAGRGIHVDGITHVVNYDVPYEAEDYVHRIGRTGRAGASGIAYTFACEQGAFSMPEIEKYIGRSLVYEQPQEAWLQLPPVALKPTVIMGAGSGDARMQTKRRLPNNGNRSSVPAHGRSARLGRRR